MNIIKVKDKQELAKKAAGIIAGQVLKKTDCVLGLATGSTPLDTYNNLIQMYQEGLLDFSKVKTYNLDEYYGLERTDSQSYYYYMKENLFKSINIDMDNVHVPDGKAQNVEQECIQYDEMIRQAGGIDLQLLGIGHNGHIGFNEPADELVYGTHKETLTESTINANVRFFNNLEEVPTEAISMGIGTIMESRSILLIGAEGKAEIIEKMISGPITPQVPASLLQLHPDVTVIYVAS